jgi:glucose/arabinose dehydrogenase
MSWRILLGLAILAALAACSDEAPEAGSPVPEIVTTAATAPTSQAPTTSTSPETTAAAPSTTGATGATSTTTTTTTTLPLSELSLELVEVARGFEQPVLALTPPGDARLLVVDQPGRIWLIDDDAPEVFVDLRDEVVFGDEQGLLGLAFHPRFATNGRLFVNYTGAGGATRVAELQAAEDGGSADPDSLQVLLEIAQPARNHNGGMIAFGPDGMLWIATGDGGGSNDRFDQGQRPDTLLGGLLRIDVSVPGEYSIPVDNPFVDGGGAPEVWSYGLRNPWRFTFDGFLLIVADVGQNRYEEINRLPIQDSRGGNFGWPIFAGAECFSGPCDTTGTIAPVVVYDHEEGCSVTGGYVYRGSQIRELEGHYFYGDYCSGWIRSLGPQGETWEWIGADSSRAITSFGTTNHGDIYVVVASGSIYRLNRA